MRFRVLALAYPFAELAAAIGVASLIGWIWTMVLLAVGVPIGFAVIRHQARSAFVTMTDVLRSGQLPQASMAGGLFAGILITVPGFVTDLIGAAMLVPAIRHRVWKTGVAPTSSTVIQGVVVRTTEESRDEPNRPSPGAVDPTRRI